MIAKKNLMNVVIAIFMAASFTSMAQVKEKVKYYISINETTERTIHEVSDFELNFEYTDRYGSNPDFRFTIYDWKRNALASLLMDKTTGLNQYTIQLKDVYGGWEMNKTYFGEMRDESGRVYRLPVKIVKPLDKPEPNVSIMVNPVKIGCLDENVLGSSVEFYGEINGGSAPYHVKWYVMNAHRTDLLYQPKEEYLAVAGKTAMIIVDKNPEYNVVLYVKDACGKEDKQIVTLTCGDDQKKINTVFVEEFAMPSFKQ